MQRVDILGKSTPKIFEIVYYYPNKKGEAKILQHVKTDSILNLLDVKFLTLGSFHNRRSGVLDSKIKGLNIIKND